MSSALASVVVLGIGCAANPWGIMIATLLLDARLGHGIVWTYVLGWTGAISVVLVALLAGFGAVFESGSDSANTAASWVELALGVVLIGFGVRRLLGSRGKEAPAETPRWLRAIENLSYPAAFLLGIYSATYPLVIAAAGEILRADTSSGEAALVVLFVVLGSSSVAGVAALGTFAPSRSAAFLERMRAWVSAHNRAVITTIVLVLGGYLTARGLEGLL